VPLEVPFTITDTPLNGVLLLSDTLPVSVFCANNEKESERKITRKKDFFETRAKPVCKFLISKQLTRWKQFFMKLKIFMKQTKKKSTDFIKKLKIIPFFKAAI
jgi:hypothetical protein